MTQGCGDEGNSRKGTIRDGFSVGHSNSFPAENQQVSPIRSIVERHHLRNPGINSPVHTTKQWFQPFHSGAGFLCAQQGMTQSCVNETIEDGLSRGPSNYHSLLRTRKCCPCTVLLRQARETSTQHCTTYKALEWFLWCILLGC